MITILYLTASFTDPDGWNNKFKKECNGNQQSPISINPSTDYVIKRAPAPFRFINYNQKLMMTITNDGHSGSFYLIIISS